MPFRRETNITPRKLRITMSVKEYRELLAAARWVMENVQLVRVDADEHRRIFGNRSAQDILATKKVSYMNACPDFTFAFIHLVKEKGFAPQLVVEEIVSTKTKLPTLHFAAEIPIGKKILTVDFTESRKVIYYEGEYYPQKSSPTKTSLGIHRYPTTKLGHTTTLNQFLGIKGITTLYKRFPHVTPTAARAVFDAMKKIDSPRLYQQFIRRQKTMKRIR